MKAKTLVTAAMCLTVLAGCSDKADFQGPADYEKASNQEKIERIKKAALSPAQKAQAVDNLNLPADEKAKVKAEIANTPSSAAPMGATPKGG